MSVAIRAGERGGDLATHFGFAHRGTNLDGSETTEAGDEPARSDHSKAEENKTHEREVRGDTGLTESVHANPSVGAGRTVTGPSRDRAERLSERDKQIPMSGSQLAWNQRDGDRRVTGE